MYNVVSGGREGEGEDLEEARGSKRMQEDARGARGTRGAGRAGGAGGGGVFGVFGILRIGGHGMPCPYHALAY